MRGRLRLPKDWKDRATHALSTLGAAGVAGGLLLVRPSIPYRSVRCGDQIGSPTHVPRVFADQQTANAKGNDVKPAERQLGIFYLVKGKLLIDSTPLSKAVRHGDHLIHDRNHDEYWAQLVSTGAVPDAEYEEHPRGRVAFNEKTGNYALLADRCILRRKGVVGKIFSRMSLPPGDTESGTDSHYRCFRCLGRGR